MGKARKKLDDLLARYGPLALAVYLVLFVVVFAGFWLAIHLGFKVHGAAGSATTLGAAWIATKITQPLRIGGTVLLTPLVARGRAWWQRRHRGEAVDRT